MGVFSCFYDLSQIIYGSVSSAPRTTTEGGGLGPSQTLRAKPGQIITSTSTRESSFLIKGLDERSASLWPPMRKAAAASSRDARRGTEGVNHSLSFRLKPAAFRSPLL